MPRDFKSFGTRVAWPWVAGSVLAYLGFLNAPMALSLAVSSGPPLGAMFFAPLSLPLLLGDLQMGPALFYFSGPWVLLPLAYQCIGWLVSGGLLVKGLRRGWRNAVAWPVGMLSVLLIYPLPLRPFSFALWQRPLDNQYQQMRSEARMRELRFVDMPFAIESERLVTVASEGKMLKALEVALSLQAPADGTVIFGCDLLENVAPEQFRLVPIQFALNDTGHWAEARVRQGQNHLIGQFVFRRPPLSAPLVDPSQDSFAYAGVSADGPYAIQCDLRSFKNAEQYGPTCRSTPAPLISCERYGQPLGNGVERVGPGICRSIGSEPGYDCHETGGYRHVILHDTAPYRRYELSVSGS